ncbi:unnamed protein product [Prorocentrum cordatum]|uniref:Peptidase M41 domain-containing protein n=1 Tax=Prorocentrum cordatum TaxID=2364126 RepID=A0ABN9STW7_9DINO|nr:unnamed protein product [Polarella glacialis]
MKDNGVDPTKLLSPRDESLEAVRSAIRAALAVGGAAMILVLKLSPMVVVLATVLLLGAAIWDQVSNGGFLELLLVDSLARAVGTDYRDRVAQHEAGHFLVGYLFGVVPKAYTLSAWDAFSNCWAFNTQAGTQLCDRAVQQEVESGKISGKTLDIIVSLAVAGVVAEYLAFGTASGGADDMRELEQLSLPQVRSAADGRHPAIRGAEHRGPPAALRAAALRPRGSHGSRRPRLRVHRRHRDGLRGLTASIDSTPGGGASERGRCATQRMAALFFARVASHPQLHPASRATPRACLAQRAALFCCKASAWRCSFPHM